MKLGDNIVQVSVDFTNTSTIQQHSNFAPFSLDQSLLSVFSIPTCCDVVTGSFPTKGTSGNVWLTANITLQSGRTTGVTSSLYALDGDI